MRHWWKSRSLKLRLTLWYAGAIAVALSAFALFLYKVVEHRLAAEIDRQLRIDFDLVEAQLDTDSAGAISWLVRGAHGDEGFARLSAWFEVWSEGNQLLLRHWPTREADIRGTLPAPAASSLRFYTAQVQENLPVRVMERPARVGERGVVVRLFRDELNLSGTLRHIAGVFVLSFPVAVFVSAFGGYVAARRSLRPVVAMAEEARKITSESLSERLSNPNPYDELGQLATIFNQTLGRLEASFGELKRFTADASHELRTPLTALRTVGEVGLRQQSESVFGLRDTISSMLEEAQRLDELIESLLALARMESGQVQVHLEPLRIADVAAEVVDSLHILAAEKQQILELNGSGDLWVNADRLLLHQALMNVVHNAIRYAPANSRILVRSQPRGRSVALEVIDEGPGIASEHQTKIFDRFYRIDKARSREQGGHGLGLAITRWSVELQGGTVGLESAPSEGSTFRLLL